MHTDQYKQKERTNETSQDIIKLEFDTYKSSMKLFVIVDEKTLDLSKHSFILNIIAIIDRYNE